MQTIKKFLLGIVHGIQESQRLRAEAIVRDANRDWLR